MARSFPIIVSYLVFIAIGAATGLLNIAWTYMQPTFGVSLDALGTLLGASMLGVLVAAFLSGALISRLSIGPVLVGGMLCAGLGVLGYALMPVWLLLLLTAFVAALGKGTMDAGINNFVASNYGASQMNWLHAFWGIGLTIAPAIVTFFVLDQKRGWQPQLYRSRHRDSALGIDHIADAALVAAQRPTSRADTQILRAPLPCSSHSSRPIVWIGLAFFFLYGGIEMGAGQLANTLLVEARGIPQETASAWVSAYWGSFTLGRILMGLLALRIGDRALLNFSFALSVVGAFCLFINWHETFSLLGLLALGFGLAAIFPILILRTGQRVGEAHTANAIGFQVGCATMGAAFLSGIAGFFAEHIGSESISFFILLGAALTALLYQLMNRWQHRKTLAVAT